MGVKLLLKKKNTSLEDGKDVTKVFMHLVVTTFKIVKFF